MEYSPLKLCVRLFVLQLFWCTNRTEFANSPVIPGF